jgi:glutaredoxin
MAPRDHRIDLLGRPGCHLCEDAREVIARVAAELGVPWQEHDLTALPPGSGYDPGQYWDQLPVTFIDGVQHDFWHVSEDRLRAALAR